jgi:tRNA pseudouridine38-40 synthase
MRFRLQVEYDGTAYAGWQLQSGQKTIQGEIEKAVKTIFGNTIRITGAGRTDSGVHARGQVAHFDSPASPDTEKLTRSLNGILAKDIRILSLEPVNEDFHARFTARKREYAYYLSKIPQALFRNFCWQIHFDLDIARMNEAAAVILGRHDFKSFCRVIAEVKNYTCEVEQASWIEKNKMFVFRIVADRFLHGMVRALVGTFIDIGRSKLQPGDMRSILDARDRSVASQSVPAKGLILEKVYY